MYYFGTGTFFRKTYIRPKIRQPDLTRNNPELCSPKPEARLSGIDVQVGISSTGNAPVGKMSQCPSFGVCWTNHSRKINESFKLKPSSREKNLAPTPTMTTPTTTPKKKRRALPAAGVSFGLRVTALKTRFVGRRKQPAAAQPKPPESRQPTDHLGQGSVTRCGNLGVLGESWSLFS